MQTALLKTDGLGVSVDTRKHPFVLADGRIFSGIFKLLFAEDLGNLSVTASFHGDVIVSNPHNSPKCFFQIKNAAPDHMEARKSAPVIPIKWEGDNFVIDARDSSIVLMTGRELRGIIHIHCPPFQRSSEVVILNLQASFEESKTTEAFSDSHLKSHEVAMNAGKLPKNAPFPSGSSKIMRNPDSKASGLTRTGRHTDSEPKHHPTSTLSLDPATFPELDDPRRRVTFDRCASMPSARPTPDRPSAELGADTAGGSGKPRRTSLGGAPPHPHPLDTSRPASLAARQSDAPPARSTSAGNRAGQASGPPAPSSPPLDTGALYRSFLETQQRIAAAAAAAASAAAVAAEQPLVSARPATQGTSSLEEIAAAAADGKRRSADNARPPPCVGASGGNSGAAPHRAPPRRPTSLDGVGVGAGASRRSASLDSARPRRDKGHGEAGAASRRRRAKGGGSCGLGWLLQRAAARLLSHGRH